MFPLSCTQHEFKLNSRLSRFLTFGSKSKKNKVTCKKGKGKCGFVGRKGKKEKSCGKEEVGQLTI